MNRLAQEHTDGRLCIIAPFIDLHKPQIYRYFQDAQLPLEATYSCEAGSLPPCGSCASCRDRRALGC
jgi:7-cyano-7-deazaguanine synthase